MVIKKLSELKKNWTIDGKLFIENSLGLTISFAKISKDTKAIEVHALDKDNESQRYRQENLLKKIDTLRTFSFQDVREIQKHLKDNNIKLETEADETTSGPASFVVMDPDGNAILIDQHI